MSLKRALLVAVLPIVCLIEPASAAVSPASVAILPGPAALNDPAPRSPQMENTGIWQADPILISGASAYRKGEFLYQDYLYDDRGATTNEPADVFITVHGTTAVVTDAATGSTLATLASTPDVERRQIQVRVPFAVYDPRGKTSVRVAAAAGLWDTANSRYLTPGTTATATTPGGAGTNVTNPPAFFNVAFRYNEPNPIGNTFTRWRDGVQGSTLAANVTLNGAVTHDLSSFVATVDFVKMAAGWVPPDGFS